MCCLDPPCRRSIQTGLIPLVERCSAKGLGEKELLDLAPEAVVLLYSPDLFSSGSGYREMRRSQYGYWIVSSAAWSTPQASSATQRPTRRGKLKTVASPCPSGRRACCNHCATSGRKEQQTGQEIVREKWTSWRQSASFLSAGPLKHTCWNFLWKWWTDWQRPRRCESMVRVQFGGQ